MLVTKEILKTFDFDDYLMQKVEKFEFINQQVNLKVKDREELVFLIKKINLVNLEMFNMKKDFYLHSITFKEDNSQNELVTILFESDEKNYDIEFSLC